MKAICNTDLRAALKAGSGEHHRQPDAHVYHHDQAKSYVGEHGENSLVFHLVVDTDALRQKSAWVGLACRRPSYSSVGR
jgi:hypothetical protein